MLRVYNLEFPDRVNSFAIDGYRFDRVANYADAFAGLQHLIQSTGGEFSIIPTTGTHQITAMVQVSESEPTPIMPWSQESPHTRLNDILFFLTVFTGRNVFALNEDEAQFPIIQDPRQHKWGGQLRLSGGSTSLDELISQLLQRIASEDWRAEYENGYFLFTFLQAARQYALEPAFLLCWTIWEHLFALANKRWLDSKTIVQISGDKKVAYVLHRYLLTKIDDKARAEIRRITRARNRLAHFGRVPDDVDFNEMKMFIRLTEQIVAITLGLKPSNVFNSFERLEEFLKGDQTGSMI